jgi:hypothetical protein
MFIVTTIQPFDREFKKLAKKYRSLPSDLAAFVTELEQADPENLPGDGVGDDCYKIRMAIASKNRGKSGGARIIYYARLASGELVLLSIYDKSEKENITEGELHILLKYISDFISKKQ